MEEEKEVVDKPSQSMISWVRRGSQIVNPTSEILCAKAMFKLCTYRLITHAILYGHRVIKRCHLTSLRGSEQIVSSGGGLARWSPISPLLLPSIFLTSSPPVLIALTVFMSPFLILDQFSYFIVFVVHLNFYCVIVIPWFTLLWWYEYDYCLA